MNESHDPSVEAADVPAAPVEATSKVTPGTRPLRVWPAYAAVFVVIAALVLQQTPSIQNGIRFFVFQLLGPLVGLLLYITWAVGLSRAHWRERLGLIAWIILPAIAVGFFTHRQTGIMLWIYGVPAVLIASTVVVQLLARSAPRTRMATVGAACCAIWGLFPFVRVDGIDGNYRADVSWRWTPEYDTTLEAGAVKPEDDSIETAPVFLAATDWPQFRGAQQDSRVMGYSTVLDWEAEPLEPAWTIDIGPGWGSFAAVGDRLFTQEQRGDDECVTCLNAATGETIWRHVDPVRFSDTVSGPGPRATPTFFDGRLFTYGSKALLNSLDAATGEVLWSKDLMKEMNAALPVWGFSNSPLIVPVSGQILVVVYVGGDADHGLCAFDAANGDLVWERAAVGMNFSSAHLLEFDEEPLVLFEASDGLYGLAAETGESLWSYRPEKWAEGTMVQPQRVSDTDILVALGDAVGLARIAVTQSDGSWVVEERWQTRALKPSFNDFVIHDGHAYGFDQNIFACIDLETGKRKWKKGRFGFGQVMLVAESGQLVVASDTGELILLDAVPTDLSERGRIEAFAGKTWNHPIIANGRLFHRNGTKAVCFTLPNRSESAIAARIDDLADGSSQESATTFQASIDE